MIDKMVVEPIGALDKTLGMLDKKIKDEKKSKASLFNLVISCEKQERYQYYLKVIHELIEHFPARIFLIKLEKTREKIGVEVSIMTLKAAPNVVCELIEIKIGIDQLEALKSLLLSNLISDLPVYYLPAEHSDHFSEFSLWMALLSKRVICDSTDVHDLSGFIKNCELFYEKKINMSDLNWSRIESWREMISKNLSSDLLKSLAKVIIEYNDSFDQYPFQALFLKEFLARRLELAHLPKVEFELVKKTVKNIWPGAILQVSFYGGKTKQVFVRNLEKPQEAIIHFESETECYNPSYVQFTKTETGQSLVKEIRHSQVSEDYYPIITRIKHNYAQNHRR